MELEYSINNICVPIAQYRYFSIQRPSKPANQEIPYLLGKRDMSNMSLFLPNQSVQKNNQTEKSTKQDTVSQKSCTDTISSKELQQEYTKTVKMSQNKRICLLKLIRNYKNRKQDRSKDPIRFGGLIKLLQRSKILNLEGLDRVVKLKKTVECIADTLIVRSLDPEF